MPVRKTVMEGGAALRLTLLDLAGLLQLEDVFEGLAWSDAQRIALLILVSVVDTADPAAAMRDRAHLVL